MRQHIIWPCFLLSSSLFIIGCSPKESTEELQIPLSRIEAEAAAAKPRLEIKPGVTLELVHGTRGGYYSCKNEKGESVSNFPVSDVLFRIRDGFMEKEENVGCPGVLQTTRKELTTDRETLIRLALEEMIKITRETRVECPADGSYAGVRILGGSDVQQFVYLVPKTRIHCKGDFITIADWELIRDTFILAFDQ